MEIATMIATNDPLATRYNLELIRKPLWEDRTDLATTYMSHLMTRQAWVEKVGKFVDRKRG
jgi:hypothetical protein